MSPRSIGIVPELLVAALWSGGDFNKLDFRNGGPETVAEHQRTHDAKYALQNQLQSVDLPPENESSFMLDWKLRKGATDGEKVLHTGADSQQAP